MTNFTETWIMNISKDAKKSSDNNGEKESFEFSFLKLRLKATGVNQEEIRKTVIRTWWLPIFSLSILALIVIFGTNELFDKLIVLLFSK